MPKHKTPLAGGAVAVAELQKQQPHLATIRLGSQSFPVNCGECAHRFLDCRGRYRCRWTGEGADPHRAASLCRGFTPDVGGAA